MNDQPLDSVLEKLTTGDPAAAEHVFRSYEPYLRMVVRRQMSPHLRAKFDSIDIVQSVWAHMLKGCRDVGWRFADAAHLRAFLVQLTRHRFIDRLRRHRSALEMERPLAGATRCDTVPAAEPRPDDLVQADDLWEQLLELAPQSYHEILRLKRDGAGTAEVAERTGLNEGSVRRILHGLAQRLVQRQQSQ